MASSIIFRIREHRGCGIQAASFAAGPQSWIPDACVRLQTESGPVKVWVRSFACCFESENITFRNKLEADNWAFQAARAIIDRALPEFEPISWPRVPLYSDPMRKIFDLARQRWGVFRRMGVRVHAD